MRAVIQRVSKASVNINQKEFSKINQGMLVLIGVETEDTLEDVNWLANKILSLRIFSDKENRMNKSIIDIHGEILVVSQFTLHAKIKKGNRPSYIRSAKPEKAIILYNRFIESISLEIGDKLASGNFGADMQISLTNNGPVTIFIDTKVRE
tara:strand:- start:61 stop:513 length:453 start_codon:yes stop_codon:yes gene_type:complete